ncbi:PfkB family carbohydrate kinase [Thermodesulfobacteriota bacterium]
MNKLHPDTSKALLDIKELALDKNKIIFVSGNFNIVHPGHLRLLRFASECGDFLIVGVFDDKHKGVLLPADLRLESVKSISWVNHAFVLRDPVKTFIKHLQPDIVAKGKEHEAMFNPEKEIVELYGGKLLFSSGDVTFSSVDLLRQEFTQFDSRSIVQTKEFLKRHEFSLQELSVSFEKIKQLKVLVIGDTVADEYITCDPLGMSQEDPTIVVTPIHKELFIGGAGIVAAHARGLGANVTFFSVVGKDHTAEFIEKRISKYNVKHFLYSDESRPTTLKQRFRADGKTLLRVNHLRQHWINRELQKKILDDVSPEIYGADLIIFSDFNYGCLPQLLVDEITSICKRDNIMMVADSQSSSQIGDVSRFKEMTLLSPTEREARLAVHDFNVGLVVLAENLKKKSLAKNIILTLGKEGMLIHAEISESNRWLTDRLPAMNMAPRDVAGAGDVLFTSASLMMAAGCNIWQSSYLASLAAACQVSRLGNIPLSIGDMREHLR